jgi:aminoglycoside 6'-N-acetyltransferase
MASERLELRPARAEDAEALVAILAEPDVARWWGAHDVARVLEDLETAFTIVVDGTVAGWLQYYEETEPDYRHVSLDIALGRAWQGRGLGPEALRAAIRHFAARGHHRFTIDPTVTNERAIRAYSTVGFEPVGVMRRYERAPDGTWRDNLLMDLLVTGTQAVDPAAPRSTMPRRR